MPFVLLSGGRNRGAADISQEGAGSLGRSQSETTEGCQRGESVTAVCFFTSLLYFTWIDSQNFFGFWPDFNIILSYWVARLVHKVTLYFPWSHANLKVEIALTNSSTLVFKLYLFQKAIREPKKFVKWNNFRHRNHGKMDYSVPWPRKIASSNNFFNSILWTDFYKKKTIKKIWSYKKIINTAEYESK